MSLTAVLWMGWVSMSTATAAEELDFFESRIRPILIQHCYECHSSASDEVGGGLLLDHRAGWQAGGDSGVALVSGSPQESLLIKALKQESSEMPPAGKLPDDVIADFERWILGGAVDPRDQPLSAAEAAAESWRSRLAERRQWWSLQPPKSVAPPELNGERWSREPVDRFVWSALQQARLGPAAPAEADVLLRRLSFVLTGLPPTSEQVFAFSPAFHKHPDQALEQLVDELLDSPHFGERIARHWMDVVRYTDTYGYEWDIPARGSWQYRDYLIRAFNADVGFDQLVREQIAGDLLAEPRINVQEQFNESLIGPMFYHLGEHRHGSSLDFNGIHQEMINNKIDAFSKAFLGMTVACARCHDHKLDAISQADYYALAGVFMTPRWTARSIDAPGKHAAEIAELRQLRTQIQQQLGEFWTAADGPLSSGTDLRQWAFAHRDLFATATPEQVAFPFLKLVSQTQGVAPGDLSSLPPELASVDHSASKIWQQLVTSWKSVNAQRQSANASAFTSLSAFVKPGFPDGWVTEGDGILHGYVVNGTPLISLEGATLIASFLPRGYHTHALSSKLPGAVRLPAAAQFSQSHVSVQLSGGEWAGYRSIPQNAFLSEGPAFFDPLADPVWTTFSATLLKNGVTRVLAEITTASLNSNFPPRTGVARSGSVTLADQDEGYDKRSWLSITGIVAHDAGGIPLDTLPQFSALYDTDTDSLPATDAEYWQRLCDWQRGAIRRWGKQESQPGDVPLLNWMLTTGLLSNDASLIPQAAELVKQYRQAESRITFPRTANSMDERGVSSVNYRLNIRGNVDDEGAAVPRNFLEVFRGNHGVAEAAGSGRLELAAYLSSHDNPQTARVFVNRVWQWMFGTGLVATPSDFGQLGDRPSHPELLDWLAIQFMNEGWSTRKLIRRLALSETFRQSGLVDHAAAERDPENRLLHHYPTRRLEAEAIRDSLLAVSGRLDRQLYGRPINPPRGSEDTTKRLFTGPLDSLGRRSLYMEMSIMEPPKFLVGFNLPDLKLPVGRRDVTNVPAQALILLNDPLVVQLAEFWGTRLVDDDSPDCEQRVRTMFIRALGRLPGDRELKRLTSAVQRFAKTGSVTADSVMTDKAAWSELAHVFFNTKEFIYYR